MTQVKKVISLMLLLTITFFGGNSIKAQDTLVGTMIYANSNATPMSGVLVELKNDQNTVVDYCYTDANGFYIMFIDPNLPAGYYSVVPSCTLPWQPVTMTSVLRIIMHSVFGNVLEGLELKAADVNGDNNIQVNDAVLVIKRIHGIVNNFPAGDWKFDAGEPVLLNSSISKEESGDTQTNDMRAKQSGDTDPAIEQGDTRKPGTVAVSNNSVKYVDHMQEVLIPVRVTDDVEVGAVSLKLKYPVDQIESIEITNAKANITSSINKENGTILITYSSLEECIPDITADDISNEMLVSLLQNKTTVQLNKEDVFFYINVTLADKVSANNELAFTADYSGCDASFDLKYKKKQEVVFEIPTIKNINQIAIAEQNFPNPCIEATTVNYILAEEGDVLLRVYNAAGGLVEEIKEEAMQSGRHSITLNTTNYQQGVYYYTFNYNGARNTYTKSFKFVVNK